MPISHNASFDAFQLDNGHSIVTVLLCGKIQAVHVSRFPPWTEKQEQRLGKSGVREGGSENLTAPPHTVLNSQTATQTNTCHTDKNMVDKRLQSSHTDMYRQLFA